MKFKIPFLSRLLEIKEKQLIIEKIKMSLSMIQTQIAINKGKVTHEDKKFFAEVCLLVAELSEVKW